MANVEKKATNQQPSNEMQNEGEGSRTAARRYNEGVNETVKSGNVERKAHEAEEALEGPEGEELRRAEEEGKRGDVTTDDQANESKSASPTDSQNQPFEDWLRKVS